MFFNSFDTPLNIKFSLKQLTLRDSFTASIRQRFKNLIILSAVIKLLIIDECYTMLLRGITVNIYSNVSWLPADTCEMDSFIQD